MKKLAAIAGLLFTVLSLSAELPKNVIVFVVNGVNQTAIDLAEKAGKHRLAMSSLNQFPAVGVVLPLTESFVNPRLACLNGFANGKLTDRSIGLSNGGEPVDSIVSRAKIGGRRVGLITDGALDSIDNGVYYAHENAYGKDKLGAWLPLCDFDLLSGEFDDERIMEMMQKIGYRNNYGADARKVFLTNGRRLPLARQLQQSISQLSGKSGMFLLVNLTGPEKYCRSNDTYGLIRELWQLDRALAPAIEFFKDNPENTLVAVVSLYDIGGLSGNPETLTKLEDPTGMADIRRDIAENKLTFRQVLALAGCAELFAEDSEVLQKLADMYNSGQYEPVLAELSRIRNQHNQFAWKSNQFDFELTPVYALGATSETFAQDLQITDLFELFIRH